MVTIASGRSKQKGKKKAATKQEHQEKKDVVTDITDDTEGVCVCACVCVTCDIFKCVGRYVHALLNRWVESEAIQTSAKSTQRTATPKSE